MLLYDAKCYGEDDKNIYVRGSFDTREKAAAAAAEEMNKAWKKFTSQFGCYAYNKDKEALISSL